MSHVMEVVEARCSLSSHLLLHTFNCSSPAHRLTVHRRFWCSRICDDVSGILKKKKRTLFQKMVQYIHFTITKAEIHNAHREQTCAMCSHTRSILNTCSFHCHKTSHWSSVVGNRGNRFQWLHDHGARSNPGWVKFVQLWIKYSNIGQNDLLTRHCLSDKKRQKWDLSHMD